MVNQSQPLTIWPRKLGNLSEAYFAVHNPSGIFLRDLSLTIPGALAKQSGIKVTRRGEHLYSYTLCHYDFINTDYKKAS